MSRISLFRVLAVLFGMVLTAAVADAAPKSVMHGAMDICQAIDGGTTTVAGGVETCCAQEVTEFDDGHIDYGDNYCVACFEGTDTCVLYENAVKTPPIRDVKKALTIVPQQAPVTRN